MPSHPGSSCVAPSLRADDPGRTRTCDPRLRGPMPCPLGHGAVQDAKSEVLICDVVPGKLACVDISARERGKEREKDTAGRHSALGTSVATK